MAGRFDLSLLPLLTIGLAIGCGYDPTTPNVNLPPQIADFSASIARVTVGTDAFGQELQGASTLTWRIEGYGERVELYAGDEPADLDGCIPIEGAPSCRVAGRLIVRPSADTSYHLVVHALEGPCEISDGQPSADSTCVTQTADVTVVAPVTAHLEADAHSVVAGTSARFTYDVSGAADWRVGRLVTEGREQVLEPCVATDGEGAGLDEADEAFCRLAPSAAGATDGLIEAGPVDSGFVLALTATNGAGDGLGDIGDGDLEVVIGVVGQPILSRLSLDDDAVLAGDTITLEWTAQDATTMELTPSHEELFEDESLLACQRSALNDACALRVSSAALPGDYTLAAKAVGSTGAASLQRTVSLEVGTVPSLSLVSDPADLPVAGGPVELAWTASGADWLILAAIAPSVTSLHDTRGCDTCPLTEGSYSVSDVSAESTWELTAGNTFGESRTRAGALLAPPPGFVHVRVGEASADGLVSLPTTSAEVSWSTVNAYGVRLEQLVVSADTDSCPEGEVAWDVIDAAPRDPDAVFLLDPVEGPLCVRITAIGAAGQSDERVLLLSPEAQVLSVEVDDQSIVAGRVIALDFETVRARGVAISVTPTGAVSGDAIDRCVGSVDLADGKCELTIAVGTAPGDVTFTVSAWATGQDPPHTGQAVTTVGLDPEITDFSPSERSISRDTDVTLAWTTENAARVRVLDQSGGIVHTTATPDAVADGEVVVEVEMTSTWTLEALSDFGSDSAQTTVFMGPEILHLTTAGQEPTEDEDALDGLAIVPAGDVSISWLVGNANASLLETAVRTDSGECLDQWDEVKAVSHDLNPVENLVGSVEPVAQNLCLRLTVTNTASEQSSTVNSVLLHRPGVSGFDAFERCITLSELHQAPLVELTADLRQASEYAIDAAIRVNGNPRATRTPCTHEDLHEPLANDPEVTDEISCLHSLADLKPCERCLSLTQLVGVGGLTEDLWESIRIDYTLRAVDDEGDEVVVELAKPIYILRDATVEVDDCE